jgi:AICAR transformylase/IMP cyclohydrolase PurH
MDKDKIDKAARAQYSTKVPEDFPERLTFGRMTFVKKLPMRYGENPGNPAAFYQEQGASGPNLASIRVLQEGSKGLSYINVADMDLGQRLAKRLVDIRPGSPVCVIIKHEMPSGVALGESLLDAFRKAWDCDPLSNFGSVDVFSDAMTPEVARLVVEPVRNIEVVFAPGYDSEALPILAGRKSLRVVEMTAPLTSPAEDSGLEFKRIAGGLLLQKRFVSRVVSGDFVDVVSERKPTPREVEAAILNWTVACFTRSNAVVIGQEDKVHGIGSGQRSRIDAAEDAIKFSKRGYGPEGCFMASDAFMPFPDVVELAAASGLAGIIYPLGSVRDQEVIDRANALDLVMLATRKPGETDCERCFLHR